MSKLRPARYGDKLQVAGDPDNPVRHWSEWLTCRGSATQNWMLWNASLTARLAAKGVQDHSN
jgi:hypothetical protein